MNKLLKTSSNLNANDIERIFEQYNNSVKDAYKTEREMFIDWVEQNANFDECYIEIPSNETKSGNPVILDW